MAGVREARPAVVISDSGGFSTALYGYCQRDSGAYMTIPRGMEAHEASFEEIRKLQEESEGRLLTFFALSDPDSDLPAVLLMAIIQNLGSGLHGVDGAAGEPREAPSAGPG